MSYDEDNVFAKILRGEIPAEKVYENEHALAFHDIARLAPVHVLVIPKGSYVSLDDFSNRASEAELAAFFRALGAVTQRFDIAGAGYRAVSNNGPDGGQEVPHFHVHIVGGRKLGGFARHV